MSLNMVYIRHFSYWFDFVISVAFNINGIDALQLDLIFKTVTTFDKFG